MILAEIALKIDHTIKLFLFHTLSQIGIVTNFLAVGKPVQQDNIVTIFWL